MNLQDLYDWIFRQNADGSGIPLKGTGIVIGVSLIVGHLAAWVGADPAMKAARGFPRNRAWGILLLLIASVWSWFLVRHMDMGEFFAWRDRVELLVPVTFVLVIAFVPEFLAVRALGALMLLAAEPVLEAAFLRLPLSRLLLPVLAYAWIIGGMFLVGMPYLLRDWIGWLTQSKARWRLAALGGVAYGALILAAALTSY